MAAGKRLNQGQREFVSRAFDFFRKWGHGVDLSARGVCNLVALCLGISIMTVWRLCCASLPQEIAENAPDVRNGRPPSYDIEEIAPHVRRIIYDANKDMRPCTSLSIAHDLASRTGLSVSSRTMRRILKQLGYRYIRGEKRHFHAESTANVAYRATYLQRKLANRDANGRPIRPEVYLDESYVNRNHVTGKTWLGRGDKRVAASGKGERICIVAAGIVYRWGNTLRSHFVPDSLQYWNSKQKCKSDDDYFNAALFQRWFEKLCQTLTRYGSCIIIMDGASYHKENVIKTPTSKAKKAEIHKWLRDNGIEYEATMVKAQLLELVRQHKLRPVYMASLIAAMYEHTVSYTPPYHPELQPIELIWANAKGWIARHPAKSVAELQERVGQSFCRIKSHVWKRAYRHVQQVEDDYAVMLEDEALACEEDDDDSDEIESDEDDEVETL